MSSSTPLQDLVAEALGVVDEFGAAGLETWLEAYPEQAEEVCARLEILRSAGLLDVERNESRGERRLGRYTLLTELGAGGMSVVHLALDDKLDRLVALKSLGAARSLGSTARERFRREALAVARLDHPNIVPIYEVDESEGVPFFTMRYVPGRTLDEVLQRAALLDKPTGEWKLDDLSGLWGLHPEPSTEDVAVDRGHVEFACRIALDLARALAHGHENGVVHRDVKPSNILVTQAGRGLLFDYGIAQLGTEAGLTQTGDFSGTVLYASPEQVESQPGAIDERTDIYSLGVTLYEMLTLSLPFQASSAREVIAKIQDGRVPALRRRHPGIARDLEQICRTAMERDPAQRYASATDLAEDLEAFLAFRPVRARPLGPLRTAARVVRRRPWVFTAAVLASALVIGTPLLIAAGRSAGLQRSLGAVEKSLAVLENILFEADVVEQGPDTPVGQVLADADAIIRAELVEFPIQQARFLQRLGAWYGDQGNFERGIELLEEALELQSLHAGERHAETADTLNFLANLQRSTGDLAAAETGYRRALDVRTHLFGRASLTAVEAAGNLASLLIAQGRSSEGEALLLDNVRALAGIEDERWTARALNRVRLAELFRNQGRGAEALESARAAVAEVEAHPGSRALAVGTVHVTAGRCWRDRGDWELAAASFTKARDHYDKVQGQGQSYAAEVSLNLAGVWSRLGRLEEARELAGTAIATLRGHHGPAYWAVLDGEALLLDLESELAESGR